MLKITVTTRTSDDACKMITQTLKKLKQIFEQLRNAKQTGEMSRKKAVWIGVMRYVISHMRCRHLTRIAGRVRNKSRNGWVKSIVEMEQQVQAGIESGALKEDGYIHIDKLMNHICAPKPGELQYHSIILWTKKSAENRVKTWDKVVRPTSDSNPTWSENLC